MCIGNRKFVNLNLYRIVYFNILTSILINNFRREVLKLVEDKVHCVGFFMVYILFSNKLSYFS